MSALTSTSTANLPQGNRGPQLIALLWVLTSVAGATVVARFVFRARKAVIGWDDIFMLISMVCFLLPLRIARADGTKVVLHWLFHMPYHPVRQGRREAHMAVGLQGASKHSPGATTQLDCSSLRHLRHCLWKSLCIRLDSSYSQRLKGTMAKVLLVDLLHCFGYERCRLLLYSYLRSVQTNCCFMGPQD
jgi:hypothetical protein